MKYSKKIRNKLLYICIIPEDLFLITVFALKTNKMGKSVILI